MATAIRPTEADLKAMMPHQTIPSIGSASARPTWQEIDTCINMCSANAASIPSDGGDVTLGHIFIVVGPVRYRELSLNNIDYVVPLPPGPVPIYPAGATMYQKDEIKRDHIKRDVMHYTYQTVGKLASQMALDAIHVNYKSAFFTKELGYRGNFADIVATLLGSYGNKTSQELKANTLTMAKPWDPITPIQSLFVRIDEGHRFDPTILAAPLVRQVVDIICVNPGFETAYKEWNGKHDADKTMTNLKIHFGAADDTLRQLKLLHTPQAPATYPGSAHSATITPPVTAASNLETKLDKLLTLMAAPGGATNTIAAAARSGRRQDASAGTESAGTRTPLITNPSGGRAPTAEEADIMSYCWSHGYCTKQAGKPDHTGDTCKRHRAGHQSTATAANKMGGETRICNSWRNAGNQQRE
jgi:hypothetical protein